MAKELRKYQEVACDYIDKKLADYSRPFVYTLPCGAGKSLVIAELAKRHGRVLVLTMSAELCKQDIDEMAEHGVVAAPFSASLGMKIVSDITVATVASAYKHPTAFRSFDIVVVDECQNVNPQAKSETGEYTMFFKLFISVSKELKLDNKKLKIVGLTATAWRNVQRVVPNGRYYTTSTLIQPINRISIKGSNGRSFFWSTIEEGMTTQAALSAGYLTPVSYYCRPSMGKLVINSQGSDFTEESLDEWGGGAVENCFYAIKKCEEQWGTKSGIVAVPFVRHAEALHALCQSAGISSCVVSSKTPQKERNRLIQAFKNGEIHWLLQCNIANVGFNSPRTDVLIWARPTLSLNLWFQAVGRVMRRCDGKEMARVVDIAGTYKMFGAAEDIHLGVEQKYKTTIEGGRGRLSGIELATFTVMKRYPKKPDDRRED